MTQTVGEFLAALQRDQSTVSRWINMSLTSRIDEDKKKRKEDRTEGFEGASNSGVFVVL